MGTNTEVNKFKRPKCIHFNPCLPCRDNCISSLADKLNISLLLLTYSTRVFFDANQFIVLKCVHGVS